MPSHSDGPPKTSALTSPHLWKITSVAVLGAFLAQMDATVVNVSLTSLAGELHGSLATIQWVTSGYLLALALTLPLNGWLVDRIGARAVYLWCFSAFTLTSALCGLAWSPDSLIGFRILQGMSGGLLAPMAQLLMARAAGERMTSVLGFAAMPVLLAPLLGPVIAGAILHILSWRWLFLVNLPFCALALVLAFIFLPNDEHERKERRLDMVGLALLSPGVACFLYGIDRVREMQGIAALIVSLVSFLLFYAWANRKADQAIIDIRLFRDRIFSAAVTVQFIAQGASFAGQFLIPALLIDNKHYSPSQAGLLLGAQGLGMMCSYPLLGLLVQKWGNRMVSVGGAVTALAGTAPFVYLAGHELPGATIASILFVRGVGLSFIGIPSISAAYASIGRENLPMATTALNIIMRIGGPTLTTICATFLAWSMSSGPSTSSSTAYGNTFALLCCFQLILCVAASRLPVRVPPKASP